MTEIRFYHMVVKRLERALPEILEKALSRRHRILVKTSDEARVEVLNDVLWTYDPASFLPHGSANSDDAEEQPVWLSADDENPNASDVLILTDGAGSEKVGDFKLVCELFDGNDDTAVTNARERWKVYKDAGHIVAYFQQDDQGRWQQKAG